MEDSSYPLPWRLHESVIVDANGTVVNLDEPRVRARITAAVNDREGLADALLAFIEAYGAQDSGAREWLELLGVAHVQAREQLRKIGRPVG